jgi:hypothetical protein
LDEERLEVLRTWGNGLSSSGRDELRAAGKAIVMLVEEIDRLQADVWMARESAVERARFAAVPPVDERPALEPPPQEDSDALALTLSERIARGRAPTEPAGG